MKTQDSPVAPQNNQILKVAINLKTVVVILLAIIAAMFALWRPWNSNVGTDDRTVQVSGEAIVRETPDEYVFYPSYQFSGTNEDSLLAETTAKSEAVVSGLKALGVEERNIKTSSGGYDSPIRPLPNDWNDEFTYTLQVTVSVDEKDQVQKVQDYLVTTSPTGQVSPQTQFSETKRKELENRAREAAAQDARAKAEKMADNIGFKIGKVKTISDNQGFGVMPFEKGVATMDSETATTSLKVLPGENELRYSVTVVYFIR